MLAGSATRNDTYSLYVLSQYHAMFMNRLTIILMLFMPMSGLLCAAANYPDRSDYLWVAVPDHDDWLYDTGEQAVVDVQFYKYGIPRDGVVEYSIGGDCLPDDTWGSVEMRRGRATIDMGTSLKPGFRDLRLRTMVDGITYKHHIKVGFGVDSIKPYTDEPADFRAFWDSTLDEAARFPLKYTKEPAPQYSNDKVEAWLVKLQLDSRGRSLYAYLLMPRDAAPGSCPVVLTPPGAGVKTIKRVDEGMYYPENGLIRLVTEIHGLDPRLPETTFDDIRSAFDSRGNGYLWHGLDSRDSYYMRHVYAGLVRCIDLLVSLPEWDGTNVVVQGGSQGGALAIVASALDPRVTLCVANHPALSDMAAGSVGLTGGYPHFSADKGMFTPERVRTMAYYDVVNFARYVKATTFLTWGYNDDTCPPTTTYAVWNTLACPKESLITPINEHWTSDATDRAQLDWIIEKIRDSR